MQNPIPLIFSLFCIYAIELIPNHHTALLNLGMAHLRLNKFKEALAFYQKEVRLNPKSHVGFNGIGVSLFNLGHHDEGIVNLEKSIAINPGFLLALENLAIIYKNKKNEALFKYYAQRALNLNPKSKILQFMHK